MPPSPQWGEGWGEGCRAIKLFLIPLTRIAPRSDFSPPGRGDDAALRGFCPATTTLIIASASEEPTRQALDRCRTLRIAATPPHPDRSAIRPLPTGER